MKTQVSHVMTRGAHAAAPGDSLRSAAQAMDELNVGVLPVCRRNRVIGVVTDRDIVVRGAARALPPDRASVQDVMTEDVHCCYEDQPLEEVTDSMQRLQIRRMPVLDRQRQLVGMLSLGDVATKAGAQLALSALAEISQPSEPDRTREEVVGRRAQPRRWSPDMPGAMPE
jgi:CBS domain-containing protein|nr:CBS domain-containing protein [uncultured Caldimonas sp.]